MIYSFSQLSAKKVLASWILFIVFFFSRDTQTSLSPGYKLVLHKLISRLLSLPTFLKCVVGIKFKTITFQFQHLICHLSAKSLHSDRTKFSGKSTLKLRIKPDSHTCGTFGREITWQDQQSQKMVTLILGYMLQ